MGESVELPTRTDCVADDLASLCSNDDLLTGVTFERQCESRRADPPHAEKVAAQPRDVRHVIPCVGVGSLAPLGWKRDGDGADSFDGEVTHATDDDRALTSWTSREVGEPLASAAEMLVSTRVEDPPVLTTGGSRGAVSGGHVGHCVDSPSGRER